MKLAVKQTGIRKYWIYAFFTTIALLLAAVPNIALTKSGGDDESRTEYYGIVQERPENGLKGEWVIGGLTFTADSGTEFELSEKNLAVGSCAKVEVRNGRVHEIDSEPMRDCKITNGVKPMGSPMGSHQWGQVLKNKFPYCI